MQDVVRIFARMRPRNTPIVFVQKFKGDLIKLVVFKKVLRVERILNRVWINNWEISVWSIDCSTATLLQCFWQHVYVHRPHPQNGIAISRTELQLLKQFQCWVCDDKFHSHKGMSQKHKHHPTNQHWYELWTVEEWQKQCQARDEQQAIIYKAWTCFHGQMRSNFSG